jgi:hypothetical protein
MTTIPVKGHTRRKPEKPREYIDTHMALFPRRSDAIRFAMRHGVPVVSADDARLYVPLPEPAYGGRLSLSQIANQLKQLAGMGKK